MEGKKNLCAMISTDLHAKIMAQRFFFPSIGSAPFLDFASQAYRKKARKAIHQV